MIFVTDYYALNKVGRLCKMGGKIAARSREEAEKVAAETGQVILGEPVQEIDAPEMGDFCDRVQAERDREWLEGKS